MRNKIMNKFGLSINAVLLFFMLSLSLYGCSNTDVSNTDVSNNNSNTTLLHVDVQLSWFNTAEWAGLYTAQEKGYYAAEGLDVSFHAPDFKTSVMDKVDSNPSMIGFAATTEVIKAVDSGKNIIAIGTLYQHSPVTILSLKEKNIVYPKDLAGKTIGVECMSNTDDQTRAFLKKYNITYTEVCNYYTAGLINGTLDAMECFATNEYVSLRLEGYEVNSMLLSNYGFDTYPNMIIANTNYIELNPLVLEKFIRASIKGIKYSIDYPEEALDYTLKYGPELNREHEYETMLVQNSLIKDGVNPIGSINRELIVNTVDFLKSIGITDDVVPIDKYYTNEILERINGE